jgi:flavin reductase (DIM6/NTAB) family NADH-FMN oxidoreductase RutF
MFTVDPKNLPVAKFHQYMLGAVGPRPIAFASTVDEDGNPNLSPFSFFNAFSANPPVLVFSPARRVRDNTTKHTYENAKVSKEVVINVVNYAMVQQMSLASTDYPKGVSEFEKAGFTPIASEKVKPFRVKESPVQFECEVMDVIELGNEGGAGNLIICKVLLAHINEEVLDANQMIDQQKIDLVARMGGDWYCRAFGDALFEVEKPISRLGIGIDALPEHIRSSKYLSGNHLGILGNREHLPDENEISLFASREVGNALLSKHKDTVSRHQKAAELIEQGEIDVAFLLLLS